MSFLLKPLVLKKKLLGFYLVFWVRVFWPFYRGLLLQSDPTQHETIRFCQRARDDFIGGHPSYYCSRLSILNSTVLILFGTTQF